MDQQALSLDNMQRAALVRRGQILEYVTIGYNCVEGMIAVIAGMVAGSIALVSFGFDSLIEVSSGLALVWRLHSDFNEERTESVEKITFRLIGACFMLPAAF